MSFKLRHREGQFPAGGFYFKDAKTGMEFKEGDFYSVVRLIIAHRKANPRLYPTEQFHLLDFVCVGNELDAYTCSRLGNDPRFCESGEPLKLIPAADAKLVTMGKPCYMCGNATGWETICPTCSGRRLNGYICQKCSSPLGKS